jgi:hypothetical protein
MKRPELSYQLLICASFTTLYLNHTAWPLSSKPSNPATNPVPPAPGTPGAPATPPAPTPGVDDRLDEGGDGGASPVDDPNDFAQQVTKELTRGL